MCSIIKRMVYISVLKQISHVKMCLLQLCKQKQSKKYRHVNITQSIFIIILTLIYTNLIKKKPEKLHELHRENHI